MYNCPQCGEETPELHEGYCVECCEENQSRVTLHNAQLDRWQSMTDGQRDAEIKDAIRRA